jgi:ABC-type lipoprotein release transport system permease subunit
MSWVIATLISIPIATWFAATIGQNFFERPLDFVFVPSAALIWLVIVMLISTAASLFPSNRAAQVSVRESLSYE